MVILSRPLTLAGRLALGEPAAERVRWSQGRCVASPAPAPGDTVSAHWDWLCGTLTEAEADALADATGATLDLVNSAPKQ